MARGACGALTQKIQAAREGSALFRDMCSDLCGVGLLNDNGCKSVTQRQRWKTSEVQRREATATVVMAEAILRVE